MKNITKALLVGAAIVGAQTVAWNVGHADALPLMQHTSGAVFQNAKCTQYGTWTVELSVTATNPELHPKVTIQNQASPIVANAPYWLQIVVPGDQESYKVSISLKWSDGFSQDLGSFTAHRPGVCLPEVTTTIAAPTTVVPPSTAPTFAAPAEPLTPLPTTAPPTVDSTPQITNQVPATSIAQGPPRTVVTPLPETGADSYFNLLLGLSLVVVAAGLILGARLGRKAD